MSLGICLLLSVSRLYIFWDGSIPKLSEAIWRTPDGQLQAWGGSPSTGIPRKKKLIQIFFLTPTLRPSVVLENSCPQHGHRWRLPALVPSTLTLNLVPPLARLIPLCNSSFRRLHKVPLHLCLFLCLSFCTCYAQSNQTENWYSLTQPWPIIVPREVGFSHVPGHAQSPGNWVMSCLAA